MVEANTDENQPPLQTMPYHPILAGHIEALQRLADTVPAVQVGDSHIQARILDGPSNREAREARRDTGPRAAGAQPGGATVVVVNR